MKHTFGRGSRFGITRVTLSLITISIISVIRCPSTTQTYITISVIFILSCPSTTQTHKATSLPSLCSRFQRTSLPLTQHIVAQSWLIPADRVVRVLILLCILVHCLKHSSVLIMTSSASILEASNQVVVSYYGNKCLFVHTGVSRTTPGIDAFRGENTLRQVWGIRVIDAPSVSDSVDALPRIIAFGKLITKLIADKEANIAPYVGTAAVARDMLSIVEALGQGSWVQIR